MRSGKASDLKTTVDHEVGHGTLMTVKGVPLRYISIRPGSSEGEWVGAVKRCECSEDLTPAVQGQIAAAGLLAGDRKFEYPEDDPGGDSDEAWLFRAAKDMAEHSNRTVEECWKHLLGMARGVLNETEEERATVSGRIVTYVEERDPGKYRFDEDGYPLRPSGLKCRHSGETEDDDRRAQ